MTQLEGAEHHVSRGRADVAGPLLTSARATLQTLRARPALDQVDRLERRIGSPAVASAG